MKLPVILVLCTVAISMIVSWMIVLTQRWHGKLSLDDGNGGVQKIHVKPVPRIGGIGVAIAICAAILLQQEMGLKAQIIQLLMIASIPVFLAGFLEDLTKRVSVRSRLVASFVSAAMAIWLLDAYLVRLDMPIVDELMSIPPLGIAFTCFAVAGVTNGTNIIDGLNGLSSGATALTLAGLATIAFVYGDMEVAQLCIIGAAAIVGFLLVNYPMGKIFLGDGGAYLTGFWTAECAVLLVTRNDKISAWTVLLACIFPVWETVFSIFRRNLLQRTASGQPDSMHLHHLVYRKIKSLARSAQLPNWAIHGAATGVLWVTVLGCQLAAFTLRAEPGAGAIGVLAYILLYQVLYAYLANNKSGYTGTGRTEGLQSAKSIHPPG